MAEYDADLVLLRNTVATEANNISSDLTALTTEIDLLGDQLIAAVAAVDNDRVGREELRRHLLTLYERLTPLSDHAYAISARVHSRLVAPNIRR